MDGRAETAEDDRGLFGRPLFADPAARALSRVGVVDIGSNSVRLVVFDGAARSPAYFYNEKIMCGLGSGLAETGRLNPDGRARALAALRRFQKLGEGLGILPLTVVATAAVREADDGEEFRAEVETATGMRLWVIDGEEEARLSAQGVLLGWPGAYGLVCDIGGSSMELAELSDGRVGKRTSTRLGPLLLRTLPGGSKGMRKYISARMSELKDRMGPQPDRLFLVGGSWRAIARIDMERRNYPLSVLHEYRMTRSDVSKTVAYIAENDIEALRLRVGLSQDRAELVPIAALVLKKLVGTFQPHDIAVSSYGIREGMLYEQMPQSLRDRDPLIEACRFAEAKDARLPGFGKLLFQFILPLFPKADAQRRRVIKAACLLHDVSWRAHPDYRHEICFDNATRANLGGLTHEERVFIGLSLLHRYKNSRSGSGFEPLYGLLTPAELREAEVLGKAMRFGAMFSACAATALGDLSWSPKKKQLELHLAPDSAPLWGEVVQARFASLAESLGARKVAMRIV
jgi:exopolyphosphatase / guanosine-5'-triphosphate,3'-diphosphate pyrophosphatase